MGSLWGNRRLRQSCQGYHVLTVGHSASATATAPSSASASCLGERMAGVYQGSESKLDHLWKAILALSSSVSRCGKLSRRTPGLRAVAAAAS